MIKEPGVSSQIGARCATDWLLVNDHETFDPLHTANDATTGGDHGSTLQFFAFVFFAWQWMSELLGHQLNESLTDQTGFAGARYPGYCRKRT
jgi:hypothetical protein